MKDKHDLLEKEKKKLMDEKYHLSEQLEKELGTSKHK